MSAQTNTPSWVAEHIEGLNALDLERSDQDVEARYPGIDRVFDDLIDKLPDSNKNSTEFPVAAALIERTASGISVVSLSFNRVNDLQDSTQHAEMSAMTEGMVKSANKHLSGLALISTCEPCVMCSGAAVNAGVTEVIYALPHRNLVGKHALVGGKYKQWRTSPESFDPKDYLSEMGIKVVAGYHSRQVAEKLQRTPLNWREHYADPDVK